MIEFFCAMPLVLLGVMFFSTANTQEKADAAPNPLQQAAGAFVELLDKGEFAKATKDFDATMQKVMPPDELKKTWEKVLGMAGAYKSQTSSRLEKSGAYQIVHVTCEFAKTKLDARVVFDKDAKIGGLFFGPAKPPTPKGVAEIWEGKLNVGATEIRLVFHLYKQPDGSYVGTMDSPDQGAKDLALDQVSVKDNAVRLELKSAGLVFEGKKSKDGQEIQGDFKQSGSSIPLTLKKVAKATDIRRPQLPKKPYPYDEIAVTYESKQAGIKLTGALTVPRGSGPFPAVLLITGSGPQDRDETLFGHKPFLVLADYLTRRGIAVLRMDDRGMGGSTGNTKDATSRDFALDVLAGVEFLKGKKEINAAQIGLIGHSEGGIIAPLVASQSRDIAFIVMLAGTAFPGDEIMYRQAAAILEVAGADADDLARQRSFQERVFAVVRNEKGDALEKKVRAALDDLTSKSGKEDKKQLAETLFMLEGQVQMVLTPWFRHFLDYDPRPSLKKVTCPVLVLNGEKDLQVDAKVNLPAIAAALKEGGNKDFTIKALPNLNHLFQTCKTGALSEYAAIEETMAPVVLETIADWISKRTSSSGTH